MMCVSKKLFQAALIFVVFHFCHNSKICDITGILIVFIICGMLFGMFQKHLNPALRIFLCDPFYDLPFIYCFYLCKLSTMKPVKTIKSSSP